MPSPRPRKLTDIQAATLRAVHDHAIHHADEHGWIVVTNRRPRGENKDNELHVTDRALDALADRRLVERRGAESGGASCSRMTPEGAREIGAPPRALVSFGEMPVPLVGDMWKQVTAIQNRGIYEAAVGHCMFCSPQARVTLLATAQACARSRVDMTNPCADFGPHPGGRCLECPHGRGCPIGQVAQEPIESWRRTLASVDASREVADDELAAAINARGHEPGCPFANSAPEGCACLPTLAGHPGGALRGTTRDDVSSEVERLVDDERGGATGITITEMSPKARDAAGDPCGFACCPHAPACVRPGVTP